MRRRTGPGSIGRRTTAAGRGAGALLAVGCIVLGLTACTATDASPRPTRAAPSSSASPSVAPTDALVAAVFAKLPDGARTAPAFTWDSAGGVGQGETGQDDDDLLLAAACDSGGALTITVGEEVSVLDCGSAAAAGPIDVTAAIPADAPTGVEVTVRPTAGHPRYVAKAVSLAPSASAPAS